MLQRQHIGSNPNPSFNLLKLGFSLSKSELINLRRYASGELILPTYPISRKRPVDPTFPTSLIP